MFPGKGSFPATRSKARVPRNGFPSKVSKNRLNKIASKGSDFRKGFQEQVAKK
jgi:hypothetical protein